MTVRPVGAPRRSGQSQIGRDVAATTSDIGRDLSEVEEYAAEMAAEARAESHAGMGERFYERGLS